MREPRRSEAGLLEHLLAEEYTRESFLNIKEVLAGHGSHEIQPVANGLFAASGSQAADSSTGYQNVWVRDNVLVANSFRVRGETAVAIGCVAGLARFLSTQDKRFREIIGDATGKLKEVRNRRPHIRFTAETLRELPELWPHAQNDALGMALWLRFLMANSGELPLTTEEWETFRLFPDYFAAIEYWRDRDSGAWEEGRKINNSSVGAVVAGLEEMQKYLRSTSGRKSGGVISISAAQEEKVAGLVLKGKTRLEETLPFEAPPERLADAALLNLIYPLRVVKSRAVQDGILNLVEARLRGEIGIMRYAGDSYFCQDYDEWFPPGQMSSDFSERLEYRDALLQPGGEAQWCIFDPVLSIIYGDRYLADRGDRESFRKQVYYFNRSLRQLTPDGKCPELYFLKRGEYVANAHTPLAWTQANQAVALWVMEKSLAETAAKSV
jgi:phosphorylase kinase alpha/beta subunit